MSGYISEFFGYRAEDKSEVALQNTAKQVWKGKVTTIPNATCRNSFCRL